MGVLMWPVMTFFTNSAIHMLAHGSWAQALMIAGGAELGLARGKLHSRWWKLAIPIGLVVSGLAFLLHEQNPWFFARSAFLHHLNGWTLVVRTGFALILVALAVMLFCDRDVAPIFGHLSPLAGVQHR